MADYAKLYDSKAPLAAGDILFGDIGYSMQMPVFYQVLRLTPSGKSAVIRELQTKSVDSDRYGQFGSMVPIPNRFVPRNPHSKDTTKRIKQSDYWGEYVTIGSGHHILSRWDGKDKPYNYMD